MEYSLQWVYVHSSICETYLSVAVVCINLGLIRGRGWGQSVHGYMCILLYVKPICSVVMLHRSMVNWKVDVCLQYMCILLYVQHIWCSGFPEIYV